MKEPARPQEQKAVIYCRVSTDRQEEEGYSLDSQLSLLRTFAQSRGFVVVKEYVEASSGSKQGRKEFAKMLHFVEANGIGAILCEKTDRFTRNWHDYLKVTSLPVDVHLVKEGRVIGPSSSSSDRLIHEMMTLMAKNFSDRLREEVSKGMVEKARQGMFPSCAPIGYLNVKVGHRKDIVQDPDRAPLVRQLFEAYALGDHSVVTLTAFARRIGLRTRNGKPFARPSIHRILTNPLYCGRIVWGDVQSAGTHEPIVSMDLYQKVQDKLQGRHSNAGSGAKEFTYRGLMTCGHCGCVITAETKKGKYIYYRCTGMRDARCPGKCSVPEREINAAYAELLEGLAVTPATLIFLQQALKEATQGERELVESQIKKMQREEKRLRDSLERLYLDRVKGDVPEQIYGSLRTRLESELAEVQLMSGAVKRTELAWYDDALAILELCQTAAIRFNIADDCTKRAIVQELQSNCTIVDRKLQIELKPHFKTLFQTNKEAKEKGLENGPFEIWYSGRDSNPRSSP